MIPFREFVNFSTIDRLDQRVPCCRAVLCLVGCSPAPRDSSHRGLSLPAPVWQPEMFPDVTKRALGVKCPSLRSTGSRGLCLLRACCHCTRTTLTNPGHVGAKPQMGCVPFSEMGDPHLCLPVLTPCCPWAEAGPQTRGLTSPRLH